jgi:chromosome partitioning protein
LLEGQGLWLAKPILKPAHYDRAFTPNGSIPIIVFANLKGGVGKTTNATNLAAIHALDHAAAAACDAEVKPTLLIDLDYQGSTSSMCVMPDQQVSPVSVSLATALISGDLDANQLIASTKPQKKANIDPHLRLQVVPAWYELAQAENRLVIEWLFGEGGHDIRYTLARVLHDPVIQKCYSRIYIDAPPRLTTACIQALCAATHLVIPTVLDNLSSSAVAAFVKQVEEFRKADISPHLKYAGIVGYKPGDPSDKTQGAERIVTLAEKEITDVLAEHELDRNLYVSESVLTYSKLIADSAGETIAVARTDANKLPLQQAQHMFRQLSASIERRL